LTRDFLFGNIAVVFKKRPFWSLQAVIGRVSMLTMGIGCGPHLDGRFLFNVWDLVGLFERFTPKFAWKTRKW
jgi:ketopantoate hydroxymethyltransferase